MLLPSSAEGGPARSTTKSANGTTCVLTREFGSEPLLFVGFGSAVGDVAAAMFRNELTDGGASSVMLNVVAAPGASVTLLHVTTPLLVEELPDALRSAERRARE